MAVVVDAAGHADTLGQCLDGLSEQASTSEAVLTVIDSVPASRAAPFALGDPRVHWVMLTSRVERAALYQSAATRSQAACVAFISAAYRPAPDWLEGGLVELREGAEVIVGSPGHATGDLPPLEYLFLSGHVPTRVALDALGGAGEWCLDDFLWRCRAAGLRVAASREGGVEPIPRGASSRATIPGAGPVPGLRPPPVGRTPGAPNAGEVGLISVVVCTAGTRPRQLDACLLSLSSLADDHFEIVVVDNSPTPSVRTDRLGPARARYVHEPARGLDRARNRGIADSSGDVVVFIDDDCEADAGWLGAIRGAFADPMVALATGRVRPAALDRASHQWFEAHFSFDRGPYPLRFTPFEEGTWSPFLVGMMGTGANMAFRRSLLERIGGFDVLLDMGTLIGGGGDVDMLARALEEGKVCQYEPAAVVFHHHRDTMRLLRLQTWGYGVCQGALCAKYVLRGKGRRLQAVLRYLRLIRDHRLRLAAVRAGVDTYPVDLVALELAGITVGPLAYLASMITRPLRRN